MSFVFFTPECPISPPPCASCNNNKRTELAGMHSLLALNTNPSVKTNLFHVLPSLQFSNTSLKSSSCVYCSLIVSKPKNLKSSCDNSATPRQSISNNIFLLLFVFDNIRKGLNELNPL